MLKEFFYPSKFTGFHMLGIMGMFFGTIIAVNLTLAFFAANSWTGLIVKNTYIASQIFDERKQARKDQASLGWIASVTYQDHFRLELKDENGNAVAADQLLVKIGRPVHEQEDFIKRFTANDSGLYEDMTTLTAGVWQADIDVIRTEEVVWSKSFRFLVED